MAELDQITVATKRYIRSTPKLVDFVFQEGPVVAYAKQNVREDYDGGRYIAENFFYNGLIGGPYNKGKSFDIRNHRSNSSYSSTSSFSKLT